MKIPAFLSIFLITTITSAQSGFPEPRKQSSPVYPPVARAVRASGIVRVQVEINSNGKVLSSTSTGGHPLLRKAAENAAKDWTFTSKPGLHFLQLTFVFTPGTLGGEDRVSIHGPYKLELIAGLPIILQTRSH